MTVSVKSILAELPEDRRKRVQAQAAEIVAEATTLSALRKARNFTQAQIASAMETSQANVAQIEKKSDVLVSTVEKVVKAMGGELELVARFEDGQSVALSLGSDGQVKSRVADLDHKSSPYIYRKRSFVPGQSYWKLPEYLTSKFKELGKNPHIDLKHSNTREYKAVVSGHDTVIERYYIKGKLYKHVYNKIADDIKKNVSTNYIAI